MKRKILLLVFCLTLFVANLSFAVISSNEARLTQDLGGIVTQGVLEISTVQKVTTSGTSAAVSNAFVRGIIRVSCSEDAHIIFATTPTATTSHTFLAGKSAEYFTGVVGLKGAAIQVSTAGICTFTEMK